MSQWAARRAVFLDDPAGPRLEMALGMFTSLEAAFHACDIDGAERGVVVGRWSPQAEGAVHVCTPDHGMGYVIARRK